MARRKKNTVDDDQEQDAVVDNETVKGDGLVLSDPGTATIRDPQAPRIINVTPDGRIRRVDF